MQPSDEQIGSKVSITKGFFQGSFGPDILTKDHERMADRLKKRDRNSKRQKHKQKRSKKKGNAHA